MGQVNGVLINPEDGQRLVDLARRVLNLFKEHPELNEQFRNVFLKASEIISYGVTELCRFALTYCIELSIFLLAFALAYDNYKRAEISVRHLRHSEEILRRLHDLYETKIHPMLVEIDNQLRNGIMWRSPAIMRNLLLQRLQETRDIMREIEVVVTNIDNELVLQTRRNKLSAGGVLLGLGGLAIAATPPGQLFALGTTVVSFFGYQFGNDNADMLREALRKLDEGRRYANDVERELLRYVARVEMAMAY